MRQSKFTETQIVSMLKEADAGRPVNEIWRSRESNGLAEVFFGSFKRDYVSQACLETVEDIARHSWGGSNTTITTPRTAPWGCSRQPSAMRGGESETKLDLSNIRWGSTNEDNSPTPICIEPDRKCAN